MGATPPASSGPPLAVVRTVVGATPVVPVTGPAAVTGGGVPVGTMMLGDAVLAPNVVRRVITAVAGLGDGGNRHRGDRGEWEEELRGTRAHSGPFSGRVGCGDGTHDSRPPVLISIARWS